MPDSEHDEIIYRNEIAMFDMDIEAANGKVIGSRNRRDCENILVRLSVSMLRAVANLNYIPSTGSTDEIQLRILNAMHPIDRKE